MIEGRTIAFVAVVAVGGTSVLISGGSAARRPATWNPRAAAAYLDQRQGWGESWPRAARDHGPVCVSCHTAVSYTPVWAGAPSALHQEHTPVVLRQHPRA